MGVIYSQPLGPNPGLARPQDSYLGETLPPSASPAAAGLQPGTFNSHFRVLIKVPSVSKVQVGDMARQAQPGVPSMELGAKPCAGDTLSGE